MLQLQETAARAACSASDAASIEARIVSAYVQLAKERYDMNHSRTVTLVRLGSLEVSLTEMLWDGMSDLAPFSLELRSWVTGATIDSLGCYDFCEDELAAAVTFVQGATDQLRAALH